MKKLTAKCFLCEEKQGTKIRSQRYLKKQRGMTWKHYMQPFQGYLGKAKNVGSRVYDKVIVTYQENKQQVRTAVPQDFC